MKAKLLALFTKDLNTFDVKIESLKYSEKDAHKIFSLNLVTSKDRKVTQLVEHLTKIYENKFKFELEDISYDDEAKKYFSELKVKIL